MKNKTILAGLILLAVLAAGIFFWQGQRFRPVIDGNVSEADRADILKLVRRDMWRRAFPDFSWRTVRRAPKSLYHIATAARILEVRAPRVPHFGVQVKGRFGPTDSGDWYWLVKSLSNGWSIESQQSTPWFSIVRSAVEDEMPNRNLAPEMELSSRSPQDVWKVVPLLLVVPRPTGVKPLPGALDGGSNFSNWISNHARLTLDGR